MKTSCNLVQSCLAAPAERLARHRPPPCDAERCEQNLQIGMFYDGTNNNHKFDAGSYSDTNVARLYYLYPQDGISTHSVYIPGVGTPFPDVGENKKSTIGQALGVGCEARVIYGLLRTLDVIYFSVFPDERLFTPRQLQLLCSKGRLWWSTDKDAAKQSHGLLGHEDDGGVRRRTYLTECSLLIDQKFRKAGKPALKSCVIDVFGFSRGAAEARAYCSWLSECLRGGRLCGVPITIRFLGIFDTVLSSGSGGHDDWADARSLRIPDSVLNCVHMVAMHEVRKNFPLDEILDEDSGKPSWIEIAYPGCHSDVGGGYRPGELGVALGKDTQSADTKKLSQIPLNHMYDCAIAAGVPLLDRRQGNGRFGIAEELKKAFSVFIANSGTQGRPLYEWMRPYLAWRWAVRNSFQLTSQFRNANSKERGALHWANYRLQSDAQLLQSRGKPELAFKHKAEVIAGNTRLDNKRFPQPAMELAALDDEAAAVLQEAMATPVSKELADFFDMYVHDSLAGFGTTLESTGYWRYRKSYRGTAIPRFAVHEATELNEGDARVG